MPDREGSVRSAAGWALLQLPAPVTRSDGVEPSTLPAALTVELSNRVTDRVSAFHAAATAKAYQ